MAFFEWEDDFSVKVAEIDRQHRRLIALVNSLYEVIERSNELATMAAVLDEIDTVTSVITELMDYASVHFKTEEQYMLDYAYPEFEDHHKEHEEFLKKVEGFRESFDRKKTRLSITVAEFIRTWWRRHILDADKRCGAFLSARGMT
jgi:hemerythrin